MEFNLYICAVFHSSGKNGLKVPPDAKISQSVANERQVEISYTVESVYFVEFFLQLQLYNWKKLKGPVSCFGYAQNRVCNGV